MRPLVVSLLLALGCGGSGKAEGGGSGGTGAAGAGGTSGAGAGGMATMAGTGAGAAAGGGGQAATGAGAGGRGGSGGQATGAAGSGGNANAGAAGAAVTGGAGAGGTGGAGGRAAAGAGGLGAGTGGRGGAPAGGAGAGRGGSSTGGAGGSAASGPITVWLAGDSTMADGETPCPVGWGKVFAPYFDNQVKVVNSAVGGRSIHTWLYNVGTTMDASGECTLQKDSSGNPTLQARWTQMLAGMKTGDYLIVQFGINDGDPSCDRHVGLDAFQESLGMMAQAAKDHGTQPIFATPVSAIACTGSTPRGTRGGYVDATIAAGMTFDVPVIDLHALSVALYGTLGFCPIPGGDVSADTTGPVGDFFCDDHTHFETAGATQIAGLIAKALKDKGLGLAAHLK
jgi:lysophospholipase L1-like esterase